MKAVLSERLRVVANEIVSIVSLKDVQYGSSWKKRGGVGAFMMLARKWDRMENALQQNHTHQWDVIEVALNDLRDEGVLDDINDLIGYLLLVRDEIDQRKALRNEDRARQVEADLRDGREDPVIAALQPLIDRMPRDTSGGESVPAGYVNQDGPSNQIATLVAGPRCSEQRWPDLPDSRCIQIKGHAGEHRDGKFRW